MSGRISRLNPPQLHETPGYHHITVVMAGRIAFIAGQCPLDAAGDVVGAGDLEAQVDQVAANSLVALATVGAGPDDVVRSVIYVATSEQPMLAAAWRPFQQITTRECLLDGQHTHWRCGSWLRGPTRRVDLTVALPDEELQST